jgi:hypothetical protein
MPCFVFRFRIRFVSVFVVCLSHAVAPLSGFYELLELKRVVFFMHWWMPHVHAVKCVTDVHQRRVQLHDALVATCFTLQAHSHTVDRF